VNATVDVVCPRDAAPLEPNGETLRCAHGHVYPHIDGIPVLVSEDVRPTQPGYWATLEEVQRARAEPAPAVEGPVDPYVARRIIGTHGNLYRHLATGLPRYPIPDFPLPPGNGARLLDIGCNWGRWSLAAAASGYDVIGIDPSFEAIVAAERIAKDFVRQPRYVVADARYLPLPNASVDVVFSFGVLQHLERADVERTVHEIARVLVPGGLSYVQMANSFGARSVVQLARRGFREAANFDVHYWKPGDLRRVFGVIGRTRLSAAGFLTLNAQTADLDLLPLRFRGLVRVSDALTRLSRFVPLAGVADSVYIESVRPGGDSAAGPVR